MIKMHFRVASLTSPLLAAMLVTAMATNRGVEAQEPAATAPAPPTQPAAVAQPAAVVQAAATNPASNVPASESASPVETTSVIAAEVATELAIDPATVAPTDDDNYNLLGEFVGEVEVGENQRQVVGLQVRPIGDDRFEGRQYGGGLPGQAGFSDQSQPLVGHRSGDFLILSGGPWAIFVEKEQCLIVDRQGKRLGQLSRIQRSSPTLGAIAPADATVLFDGRNTDQFNVGEMTEDGLLLPGADVKPMFQDFNMHVEFRLPYMPAQTGQARGNSGCYLLSRYEVQVLDSFSEAPTFNGCSSLYRQKAPDLNMCLPPLQWQTYDIAFTAPRWAGDGSKIRNGRITVWQNGVKTQDDAEILSKTGAGQPEEPSLLPIRFQNHKDPVRFRNIWIIDRGLAPGGAFPVLNEANALPNQ